MITLPNLQGKGIGTHLLRSIEPALTILDCYCFAFSHLTGFYQNNGFMAITVETLPDELQQRFHAYTSQGRKLTPMKHIGSPINQKSASNITDAF